MRIFSTENLSIIKEDKAEMGTPQLCTSVVNVAFGTLHTYPIPLPMLTVEQDFNFPFLQLVFRICSKTKHSQILHHITADLFQIHSWHQLLLNFISNFLATSVFVSLYFFACMPLNNVAILYKRLALYLWNKSSSFVSSFQVLFSQLPHKSFACLSDPLASLLLFTLMHSLPSETLS